MSAAWTLEHEGAVAFVRFTRPPINMMSFRAIAELRTVLEDVATDPDARIVVLVSGVADYFVAHADHEDMGRMARGDPPEGDAADWPRTLAFVQTMPQPVVTAVDGQAWGGGCELALACAFRLASPRAHFAQMEILHGVIPGAGGTQRLPRLIGPGPAARMIMTGAAIDATTALGVGLVDAVPAARELRGSRPRMGRADRRALGPRRVRREARDLRRPGAAARRGAGARTRAVRLPRSSGAWAMTGTVARSAGSAQGLILSSQALLLTLGPVLLVPILPLVVVEYHARPNIEYWATLLVTTPSLCIALFSILAGVLGDRVGRRRLLLLGLVAYGACGLAPVVLRDFTLVFASRIAFGGAQAIIVTISATLIGDYFDGRARDRWLAAISVFASLAGIVGIAASGWIAARYGWRASFWLYGLGLAYLPLTLFYTWEPQRRAPETTTGAAKIPLLFMAGVCLVTLVGGVFFYAATVQIGRAFSAFGFGDAARMGTWIAIASIGVPLGATLFSVAPRLKTSWLLAIEFALFGAMFVALAHVGAEPLFVAAAFLSLIAAGLLMPTLISWAINGLAPEVRGICVGIFQSTFALSSFCSGLIVSALSARLAGVLPAFTALGWAGLALAVAAAGCALVARPHR